ncbi:MAG: hypothetical protein ABR551_12980 [Gemmatimonadales bacterium]
MPDQISYCRCDGTQRRASAEIPCSACGGAGQFTRWTLNTHERMARYQYVTGLKPIGPHRTLAGELLNPLRAECPGCAWEGIHDDHDTWRVCASCEGTGGHWTVDDARIRRELRKILRRFPEAAAPATPGFLTFPLLFDVAEGMIVTE